jgi:hypothetical protein
MESSGPVWSLHRPSLDRQSFLWFKMGYGQEDDAHMLVVCGRDMSCGCNKASLSMLDGVQWCRRRTRVDDAVGTAIVDVACRREGHTTFP